MDLFLVLAQDPAGDKVARVRSVLERFFDRYPPEVTVPVFIAGLVLITWLVERIVLTVLRRMTARTDTKVDDALANGLPTVLRPLVVFIALHVIVQQFLRDEKDPTRLSSEGALAEKAVMVVSIIVLAIAITRVGLRMLDAWISVDPARHPVGAPMKLGLKVGMVPLAFLAALQAVDYPISSFLTALGIGSLAVGLALQDTLKNMFAGIQIVLDQPIRAGDFVEIDRNARGTVMEIGLRSTKLRSVDNNIIVIPNAIIAGAVVTNFDTEDRCYVQSFQVCVAYGSDTRRVCSLLEEVATAAHKDLPGMLPEPATAAVTELGESGVNVTVSVKLRQFIGRAAVVSEIYQRFHDRLRAEGIDIPYPTRTVLLRPIAASTSAGSPSPAQASLPSP